MTSQVTPSKRPFERNPSEPYGRGKWQKTTPATSQQGQFKVLPWAPMFRILCPSSKTGGLIGKGGSIVAKIRQETGAKIKLEENIPGCDERVVIITSYEKEKEKDMDVSHKQSKENEKNEQTAADNDKDNDNDADAAAADDDDNDNEKESVEKNEGKEESAVEGSKPEKVTPSVLKALLLVFERIVEMEEDKSGGDEGESEKSSHPVSLRLLVLSGQVGRLLGKGGSVIKQMSADTGAHIRVLPKDKLPLCASWNDEIVQITGGMDSVRKALHLVGQQLLDNPPRERDSFILNQPGSFSHPLGQRPEGPPANYHLPFQGPPFPNRSFDAVDYRSNVAPPFPKFHESVVSGPHEVPPEIIVYRLLCSNVKVGGVIGKGGSVIKNLQHETGCEIKVLETTPESEDRIIVISGPVHPSDRISPPQNAVLLVQRRLLMAVHDKKESNVTTRVLVASHQTGCLLGKGGSVIAEMRKLSGAHIRILGKDQIPIGVQDNDEVVQVNGEFEVVQEALVQITTRLRHHLFREKFRASNPNNFGEQVPPFGPFMGRREFSPPRYPNMPPFQKDPFGRPFDERPIFGNMIHSPGVPHGVERSGPWPPQGMREGGPMPPPDYPGGPQRRMGGFSGANQPPVITNTTVDVVVPRSLVPSLYGEDGGCLRRIREISEAKISITEPRPEATETVIIISGTPEQTHAAQSLIQAFVLSESGST
ncbi:RNA-binding KH domain-containing protein RCF3-like [Ananas comosus]|uniref:KH domain-containing protein n=1 Tax=Ananas comosus TaxID=4615 RepID=A0A199W4S2_ANACO|nr:RNA-binding KH domain-containing protein RCF3-like [Ananas comosus]XP_020088513.1 RNA-binding KH domain-containing protein RCF3-like [Ananas comosus]XP_020088514.1 RNA-binding KH domain-containing protein RCF3-like [Ananas comosus]XP_020088515.1 RNA-binding KH domain-containing protein RCF3-like [Ananas comosus]OAY84246.1 KH domain-containing protein [Ananas comosus]